MLEPLKTVEDKGKIRQKYAENEILCRILELVRTAFAACGGEEVPPRIRQLADGKAVEPHE